MSQPGGFDAQAMLLGYTAGELTSDEERVLFEAAARDQDLGPVEAAHVAADHGADRTRQVRVDGGLQHGGDHEALRHHARGVAPF